MTTGLNFVNCPLREGLEERGMRHDRSAPGNPEQNGVAERDNRTLGTNIRTLLISASLPAEYGGGSACGCYAYQSFSKAGLAVVSL